MYELLHEYLIDLRLRILENLEILTKSLLLLDLIASTQPTNQNVNFDICTKKPRNISFKTFHRKTYFI